MHIKNRKTKQELNKDRQEKTGGGMIMITTEVRKEKNRKPETGKINNQGLKKQK